MFELTMGIVLCLLGLTCGLLLGWLFWRGQTGGAAAAATTTSAAPQTATTVAARADGAAAVAPQLEELRQQLAVAERARTQLAADRDELARTMRAERAVKDRRSAGLRARLDAALSQVAELQEAVAASAVEAPRAAADLTAARSADQLRRRVQRLEAALVTAQRSNDTLLDHVVAGRRDARDLAEQLAEARADVLELGAQRARSAEQLQVAEAVLAAARQAARDSAATAERRGVGETVVLLDGGAQPLRIPTLDPDLSTTSN